MGRSLRLNRIYTDEELESLKKESRPANNWHDDEVKGGSKLGELIMTEDFEFFSDDQVEDCCQKKLKTGFCDPGISESS